MPDILSPSTRVFFNRLPERTDPATLEISLKECAETEYRDLLEGKVPTSSISSLMAYRLLLMVRLVFDNQIPSEDQVAAIFHVTIDRARSIIKTMQANYSGELDACLKRTIVAILKQRGDPRFTDDGEFRIIEIRSTVIVNQMNQILSLYQAGSEQIRRKPRVVGEYLVSVDARKFLLRFAGEPDDER